ncbi:hypothetical protein FNV43_RR16761 [Rhamnella rubrinervis]|uniref:Uncharacterized protein n=1 Tax=Rhamnella rubrinervis TaxID=2594499 RepID=A0A8K0GZG9_9ROSA|nr:hypothetical protein FNV43_RR16761 [Rhamnella rubrinervis]
MKLSYDSLSFDNDYVLRIRSIHAGPVSNPTSLSVRPPSLVQDEAQMSIVKMTLSLIVIRSLRVFKEWEVPSEPCEGEIIISISAFYFCLKTLRSKATSLHPLSTGGPGKVDTNLELNTLGGRDFDDFVVFMKKVGTFLNPEMQDEIRNDGMTN